MVPFKYENYKFHLEKYFNTSVTPQKVGKSIRKKGKIYISKES